MNKVKSDPTFDSSNLILFVLKKWKPIFSVTILGAILAAAASFLITPEFEATAIIYPSESSSFAKTVISDLSNESFLELGGEEEVEKTMQIIQSDKLKQKIIKHFNLIEHYEIDKDSPYLKNKVENAYDKNVKISRTEYLSIQIDVRDRDPKMAAEIANSITNYLDTVVNEIRSKRAQYAMHLLDKKYKQKQLELKEVQDSLKELHLIGFHNYEAQAERYSEAYAKALAAGQLRGAQLVKNEMDKLAEHANAYNLLTDLQKIITGRLRYLKKKIEEAELEIDNNVPHKYVVEEAQVPQKKAYPVRSLIVLAATFASFILILLVLLIRDWSIKRTE